MNNEDFRALVSGPTRFDLQQVEQWDKELRRNQKKAEKFAQKRKKSHTAADDQEDEDKDGGSRYRNRAEERRKGHNPDYDEELARIVEEDAEKSAFMGGDEKFTHLVKGLDHALLSKVKRELEEAKLAAQQQQLLAKAAEYTPNTAIGRQVKEALHRTKAVKAAAPVDFSRITFEYDISPAGAEVPLIAQRSRIESSPEDTLMMFTVPQRLLDRVTNVMEMKVYFSKGKKKRKLADGEKDVQPTESKVEAQQPKQPTITSIFDDDDIGVYVPPGAIEQPAPTQPVAAAGSGTGPGTSGGGGYFSALKATKPSERDEGDEEEGARQFLPQHTSEEDLTDEQKKQLKKSLLPFLQSSKRLQSSSASSSTAPGTRSDGDGEIDEIEAIRRQIEERKRAAGGSGAGKAAQLKFADYDGIYPETAELGSVYESDEEDGGRKRKKGAPVTPEPPKAQSMAPDDF